jgi:peptidoglycan/LPS O-acetylase OafA/YrhL
LSGRQRVAWLDGMRALAVLGVVVYHEFLLRISHGRVTGELLPNGALGVDVFFVLSGFLITGLLIDEWDATRRIGFKAFYARRAARLLPALAVMLSLFMLSALFIDTARQFIVDGFRALAAIFYVGNWVRAFGIDSLGNISHIWTLAIEEQFYLLWPPILFVLLRRGIRGKRLAIWLAAAGLASGAWRFGLWVATHNGTRLGFSLDTHADGLLLGCALAVALHAGVLPTGRFVAGIRRTVAVLAALGILVVFQWPSPLQLGRRNSWVDLALISYVAVATTLVLWELVSTGPGLAHRALSWRPLAWLGRISYGVYLFHPLVTQVLTQKRTGWSSGVLVPVHIGLGFGLATASWYLVEQPVLRRRRVARGQAMPQTPPDAPIAPDGDIPFGQAVPAVVRPAEGATADHDPTRAAPARSFSGLLDSDRQ